VPPLRPDSPTEFEPGSVIAGRYELGSALPERPDRFVAADLARSRTEVELGLWPIGRADWSREGARLRRIAELRSPTLVPLTDFGRVERDAIAFAVGERMTGLPLDRALRDGATSVDRVLVDMVWLAQALNSVELPPSSLAPELISVDDGRPRVRSLDIARPLIAPPSGTTELARTLLEHADAGPAARRLLERWSQPPGPRGDEALRQLRRFRRLREQLAAVARPRPASDLSPLLTPLRDLVEAGRGSVVILSGDEQAELRRGLALQVRADGLTLVDGDARHRALAAVARQLRDLASPAFVWRHGGALALLERSDTPADAAPELAARLLRDVAAAQPVVLLLDVGERRASVVAELAPLLRTIAHDPAGCACLAIVAATPIVDGDPVAQLTDELRQAANVHRVDAPITVESTPPGATVAPAVDDEPTSPAATPRQR